MFRVLLADDHAVVRRGFRRILAAEPNCQICAEAASGSEAVSLAALYRPDIAILDLVMPGLSGIGAAQRIRAILPECEIAIVTLHDADELIQAAIAAGARAYLLKSDTEQHLVPAVRSLARHQPYFLGEARSTASDSRR